MGAHFREVVQDTEHGEPRGEIRIDGTRLHGTVIAGNEIPNVIDEIPILAVAGSLAPGERNGSFSCYRPKPNRHGRGCGRISRWFGDQWRGSSHERTVEELW